MNARSIPIPSLAMALLLGASSKALAADDAVEIREGVKVQFASADAGARRLASRDVFVRALSPFDRSARLKTDRDVSEADYLAFVARQARDWTESEKLTLRAILQSFRSKTAALDLRFPHSISLVKTTGLEEGMAAYCRDAAVVLPARLLQRDSAELESTVFHELFHIYGATMARTGGSSTRSSDSMCARKSPCPSNCAGGRSPIRTLRWWTRSFASGSQASRLPPLRS